MAPLLHPPQPPPALAHLEHLLPTRGQALELACGRGRGAVWLACRGMQVHAVDVSPVAMELARRLSEAYGVSDRCRFEVWDLDNGLPPGPPVDLIFCHMLRQPHLDQAMVERLRPGGMLAIVVQSEVGTGPGHFRAAPGQLRAAFGHLEVLGDGEGDGVAWLLARVPSRPDQLSPR